MRTMNGGGGSTSARRAVDKGVVIRRTRAIFRRRQRLRRRWRAVMTRRVALVGRVKDDVRVSRVVRGGAAIACKNGLHFEIRAALFHAHRDTHTKAHTHRQTYYIYEMRLARGKERERQRVGYMIRICANGHNSLRCFTNIQWERRENSALSSLHRLTKYATNCYQWLYFVKTPLL